MFNRHQKEYMKYLSELPPESRCWCGWYPIGECNGGGFCPTDKTCADKMAVEQALKAIGAEATTDAKKGGDA